MPLLEAQICDVWGDPIAGATIIQTMDGGGLIVTEPLNDSRTAELTISCHDPVARHAVPLSRVLSVTYGPYLVFKGPILQTSTDYAAGAIRISAHDATIRLKHHYHRYSDTAVANGVPVDGAGMRTLIESSEPSDSQLARGIPPNGILWGNDTSTHQGPKPTSSPPDPGDGIWRPIENGMNVWESVQNLSQAIIGPDFRFQPIDRDHPGSNDPVPAGFYCELDTADQLGEDRSDTVVFEFGQGTDTAANVVHEPQGDLVRNWFAQVYPGGERRSSNTELRAIVQNYASEEDYGVMQGWESSGQRDSHDMLEEKARAWVQAYHRPPDFFTVTPRFDQTPNIPGYGHDYRVGDRIRVRARTGSRDVDLVGRIVTATIEAVDQSGNVRVSLDCVPTVTADFDPDEETEP